MPQELDQRLRVLSKVIPATNNDVSAVGSQESHVGVANENEKGIRPELSTAQLSKYSEQLPSRLGGIFRWVGE